MGSAGTRWPVFFVLQPFQQPPPIPPTVDLAAPADLDIAALLNLDEMGFLLGVLLIGPRCDVIGSSQLAFDDDGNIMNVLQPDRHRVESALGNPHCSIACGRVGFQYGCLDGLCVGELGRNRV